MKRPVATGADIHAPDERGRDAALRGHFGKRDFFCVGSAYREPRPRFDRPPGERGDAVSLGSSRLDEAVAPRAEGSQPEGFRLRVRVPGSASVRQCARKFLVAFEQEQGELVMQTQADEPSVVYRFLGHDRLNLAF